MTQSYEPLTAKLPFEAVVAERHAKVSAIVTKHLKAMHDEILTLDPESMNIDYAGDQAEIVRQVIAELGKRLRDFSRGARSDVAEKERELKELFGEDEGDEIGPNLA